MTSSTIKYDAIIIGSGQGGTPLSTTFAQAGHRTALIESSHIGGCCVNEGCTPTKTLIASGRVAYLTRRGQDYGIHTSGSKGGVNDLAVDMEKVRQRKRDIGTASFLDAKKIKVKLNEGGEKVVEGEKIFINTGERPAPPKLSGLEEIDPKRILNSTSVMELGEVPEHLVVLGGGYVGCEFAQLFRRLGANVTIIQRAKQLVGREDPEIASCLADVLTEDGLAVHLNSTATSISKSSSKGEGYFDLKFYTTAADGSSKEEKTVTGTHILAAAGRIPNTEQLDLHNAGVSTTPRGYIVSNEYLETNVPNIYVLGDVKGPPAFTHISYDDYRILKHNLLTIPSLSASQSSTATKPALPPLPDPSTRLSTTSRLLPYVVYTDPQLGHIGLHEHEARALYPSDKTRIKTAKMPMSYVARALETDETRGMMKAVMDSETGLILGFTCLGLEGGEVMSIVQMAMLGKVRWEVLRDAVWAHPALAESLNNLWGFLE
ncbi:hypothetical protein F5884DRAFT_839665 [Xylogone sp. PMI_703]|nr:hypothetical protein F5884DRAFT_839665 [Xylogone sp. PMI_703]